MRVQLGLPGHDALIVIARPDAAPARIPGMDRIDLARRTADLQLRFEENFRDARTRAERRAAVAETLAEWRRQNAGHDRRTR